MRKIYSLKDEWTAIAVPVRIKQELSELFQTTGQKSYWRVIEHAIRTNKELQKFKKSKAYSEVLSTGKLKEENAFFQELERIDGNMKILLSNQKHLLEKFEEFEKDGKKSNNNH